MVVIILRMTLQKQFAAEIAKFLKLSGMARSTFGRSVMGDPGFVDDLDAGRAPTLTTIERARKFMASHKQVA
jgi:hypothetical protein